MSETLPKPQLPSTRTSTERPPMVDNHPVDKSSQGKAPYPDDDSMESVTPSPVSHPKSPEDVEEFIRKADFSWMIHFKVEGMGIPFSQDLPLSMWYDVKMEIFHTQDHDPASKSIEFITLALDNKNTQFVMSQCCQIKFLKASGTPLIQVEDWYFYIQQRDQSEDTYEIPI